MRFFLNSKCPLQSITLRHLDNMLISKGCPVLSLLLIFTWNGGVCLTLV